MDSGGAKTLAKRGVLRADVAHLIRAEEARSTASSVGSAKEGISDRRLHRIVEAQVLNLTPWIRSVLEEIRGEEVLGDDAVFQTTKLMRGFDGSRKDSPRARAAKASRDGEADRPVLSIRHTRRRSGRTYPG